MDHKTSLNSFGAHMQVLRESSWSVDKAKRRLLASAELNSGPRLFTIA